MSSKIRAKILNIIYNKENNLFKLTLKDIDKDKSAYIAIKGTDWGITPDVPEDIINQFCEEMKGKEKNLFIEVDNLSIERGEDGYASKEGIDKIAEILTLAVEMNIIQKAGSWYSYEETKLGQGAASVKDVLRDNPELYEEIEGKVIENFKAE